MSNHQRRRILVVEDEGLIAHDIERRLEALGHEVVGLASTAEEALELASNADLILMDIRIDGRRDGIETATEIRNRYHIPVIFLTAHADRETLDRAKAAGPFGYIVKPLGPSSLQAAIEMAVYKHRTDRELEEREAWLRTTIESAADAIIVTDASSRIRLMNPAAERLTGWTIPEASAQSLDAVLRMVDAETGEDFGDPVPLAILRGNAAPLDRNLRLVARNGREIEIEGTTAPAIAGTDTLGTVVALRDVSLKRFEERQLRTAQRMETAGRLAARVSGEYSLLIESIRGQADALLRQLGSYGPARQAIEEILRTAAAAAQATRRLSDFGTRQIAHPEILSINAVLRRMSKLIESAAGPGIAATVKTEPNVGRIRADSSQIEQAVLNMVLHACSVMTAGGRMLVETNRAEAPLDGRLASFVVLSVFYTAAEADAEHFFDPAGASEDALALSVAHSIATEHGGYLIASPCPDGTRLDLFLPRVHEELTAPELTGPADARTLLLVDYRDRVRAQLHNFFEQAGYSVIEAADRDEAATLAQVHEGSIDLMIAEPSVCESMPEMRSLAVVDEPETSPRQIRRPFTQKALLERVDSLIEKVATSSA